MKTQNNLLFANFTAALTTEQKKEFDGKDLAAKQNWYINYLEDQIFELDAKTSPNGMIAELRNRGYAVVIWGVEDIGGVIENHFEDDERLTDNPLTEEEKRTIMETIDHQHDCNFGITWEHLIVAVEDYLSDRENRLSKENQ